MKWLSHSTSEQHGIRYRGAKLGPLTYASVRGTRDYSADPARFVWLGRLSIARGPMDGLLEGLEPRDRHRVLRHAHPSVVLAYFADPAHDEEGR